VTGSRPHGEEPSGDDFFRRITPAPGRSRWPGLVAVLVRWRMELLLTTLVIGLWYLVGGIVVGLVGLVVAVLAAVVPTARHGLLGALLAVVVLHRVRAGLVQAGVGDRVGRPPWLPWARPTGAKGVVVGVWLRAGTTPGDLRAAAPVVAAACGAAAVEVEQRSGRNDRAELHVVRPRWGWPGR
jgi:hypothetical protein